MLGDGTGSRTTASRPVSNRRLPAGGGEVGATAWGHLHAPSRAAGRQAASRARATVTR